mgnify:FL=1
MDRKDRRSVKRRGNFWVYELVFCGVIVAMFLLMKIVPFFLSIGYAFTDWNGISGVVTFNGVQNFIRLLGDTQFWYSLRFTLAQCLVAVISANLFGFFLAYFLVKPLKARGLLRAGFYLPNVIGGLVLGFIWQFIFLKVFPAIGEVTGIGFFELMWLGTPATAFWGLCIVQAWSFVGYYMLLYIAGFTALPSDCLESARVDGANARQTLFRIIVPLMRNTFTRCLFLSIVNSFKIYTVNMALTDGGPWGSSEGIAMNIYKTAFTENSMGYGSAKSLVFTTFVILFTALQLYLTSKGEADA